MIAQVLAFQSLEALVLGGGEAEGCLGNLRCQDCKFSLLGDAAVLPFVGEFIAHGDAADAFLDPVVGVSFVLIDLAHALLGEFWIFDFLDALIADFREPAFEGFGLGGGDGLDDAEGGFGVDAVCFVTLAVGRG